MEGSPGTLYRIYLFVLWSAKMISSLIAGCVLGLSSGLAPGPLLTLVITQTLKHGMREGFKVALAPLITDFPIVAVSLLVLSRLAGFERILGAVSCAGGLYVLYLAYECMRTGPITFEATKDQAHSLKKGTLINALNPHPYLFWITVGSPLLLKFRSESVVAPFVFVSCFYALLVGSKVCLALVVGKSRTFLRGKRYIHVMRILGGMLAMFALLLLKDALVLLGLLAS
jgi:threonine/homoserine/homoserine lactone efflux protein